MVQPVVGVIGGSGLYEMKELKVERRVKMKTPFGDPSDAFIVGKLKGVKMAFLPRHGLGHRLLPSEINYRANIWGMKKLGVEYLIASGTCGSFKEELAPGEIVVIDQFLDRTRLRQSTFLGRGIAGHPSFADPVCPELSRVLFRAGKSVGAPMKMGGTYVCMEGPHLSTRAESFFYKGLGADVIGMTNLTEAKLAREAEICYASLALVTDYDCWHETEADVTIEMVLEGMRKNVERYRQIVKEAVTQLPPRRECACASAMQYAIITDPKVIPAKVKKDLKIILGKYLK